MGCIIGHNPMGAGDADRGTRLELAACLDDRFFDASLPAVNWPEARVKAVGSSSTAAAASAKKNPAPFQEDPAPIQFMMPKRIIRDAPSETAELDGTPPAVRCPCILRFKLTLSSSHGMQNRRRENR